MSEIEALRNERNKLRNALIALFRVVDAGDWYAEKGWMQIPFDEADKAFVAAEKVITETGDSR